MARRQMQAAPGSPPPSDPVSEFVRRRNALRAAQAEASIQGGERIAAILERLSKDLAVIVASGANNTGVAVVSDAEAAAMLREIDAEIARVMGQLGAEYRSLYAAMLRDETAALPNVYSALGRTTANRVRGALGPWQDRMRTRYQLGFSDWMQTFNQTGGELRGHLARSLTQARIEGWNSRQLATELLRSPAFRWENLPPVSERGMRAFGSPNLGKNDLLRRRAQVIARTKLTAARQESNRVFAEETGMDLFVNVNGDPVSGVCKEANAAGAQTWEWWASNLGIPPRHPNCDSDLAPVPEPISRDELERAEALVGAA